MMVYFSKWAVINIRAGAYMSHLPHHHLNTANDPVIVNVDIIRQTINNAKHAEDNNGHLAKILASRLNEIHRVIHLPKNNEINALFHFVNAYIDHVPNFIEAVAKEAKLAGLEAEIFPFLNLAEKYFLSPPLAVQEHLGLDELMDEAYLAHRLIEEVNDYYFLHTGAPLMPMDMTRANLIIHSLIGESFANKLDATVHDNVNALMRGETGKALKLKVARLENWSSTTHNWPCLSSNYGISLILPVTT
jgi:hypothetical protein